MSVPDDRAVITAVYASGTYDLKTHDGLAAFVDAAIARLHLTDRNWGHLRKRPGQTHVHLHAEDAALYKLPDNQARAVDFVIGARGENPSLGWGVDTFPYTHADWLDPDDHAGTAPTPPAPQPQTHTHPGREEMMNAGEWLDAYYRSSEGLGRSLTKDGAPDWEGIGAWLFDVYFMGRVNGNTPEQARASVVAEIQKTHEWRSKHGQL